MKYKNLERASRALIEATKIVIKNQSIINAKNVKGAFVGGMAVHNLDSQRETRDVDFQISGLDLLQTGYNRKSLKRDIIKQSGLVEGLGIPIWTSIEEKSCALTFAFNDAGKRSCIHIDIIDESVSGWDISSSSKILTELHTSKGEPLPFANREDILCTKVTSAFERYQSDPEKSERDCLDIIMMIEKHKKALKKEDKKVREHLQKFLPKIYNIVPGTGCNRERWAKALGIQLPAPSEKK